MLSLRQDGLILLKKWTVLRGFSTYKVTPLQLISFLASYGHRRNTPGMLFYSYGDKNVCLYITNTVATHLRVDIEKVLYSRLHLPFLVTEQ
jgi:hypothetical protein